MNNPISPDSYISNLSPNKDDSVDLKRYFSLFISNWYWFVVSLFLAISVAYGINRWTEEVYTVSSTLLIKDDQNGALTEIFPGSEGFRSMQKVNNEIGILKSFNLNYRVILGLPEFHVVYTSVGRRGIAETRLYKTAPFIVKFDSLARQKLGEKINIKILSSEKFRLELNGDENYQKDLSFGERFNEKGFDFTINLRRDIDFNYNQNASNKYYFYFVDPASLANQYRNKLSINPIDKEASLVTLSTAGFVPQQEADYLNTLMKVYLEFGLEYKNQTAAQTIDFIENQLGTISDSLKIAENDLENFRLVNKLINISREGTIIQDKLEQIDSERSRLLIQKNYYQYLKEYVDSKNENADVVSPSVIGITDQILIKMVEELAELQKQKKQLSINLNATSEPLLILNANISNARESIRENISNGLSNIEKAIDNSDKRLNNIDYEIKRLPSTERQMINIQRKFDINNTVYTFLLEKRAEAGIAKASNVPDNRIIDKAGFFSSYRIKPKRNQNLMTAIMIGLFLPLLAIVLIYSLNNKIIDKKDIEQATTIPIIGYINHNSQKTELPIVKNPGSTLSESFRSVRTNLKYFLREKECSVIAVSSTVTSEGKTFVSTNLATIFAMSGKKTLLIGLDLRKPRIHKIFGTTNDTGMSNLLTGREKFESILYKTEIDNLWYAPSGPVPPNPAELIESDYMKSLIDSARKEFDFIVIDTPPVAIVTDALLVSQYTDFYLFVVRQRYSSKNTLELVQELYNRGSIKNLGIVINDISLTGYYGYGLRYGYSSGYGYSYGFNYYNQANYGKYGYKQTEGYYKES
ncbi:MAG TPA: polysaccharide biosynthesis tyrosine autokinase [Bacteroidales bacterium]|nr:polysaccharide biosynthesis tyrosine autokinase [Bacteroidales bacterium]